MSNASPSSVSWSAKKRKLRATRGITELVIERRSEPLSRVSTAASCGTRSSTRSAIAVQDLGAFLRAEVRPRPSRPRARRRRRERPRRAAARDLGERRLVDRRDVRRTRTTTPRARRRSSARSRPRRPRRRRSLPYALPWPGPARTQVVRSRTVWAPVRACQAARQLVPCADDGRHREPDRNGRRTARHPAGRRRARTRIAGYVRTTPVLRLEHGALGLPGEARPEARAAPAHRARSSRAAPSTSCCRRRCRTPG